MLQLLCTSSYLLSLETCLHSGAEGFFLFPSKEHEIMHQFSKKQCKLLIVYASYEVYLPKRMTAQDLFYTDRQEVINNSVSINPYHINSMINNRFLAKETVRQTADTWAG